MKTPHILIVNGPNLNLLGTRQPEIYGTMTLEAIIDDVRADFDDIVIDEFQSNHEGALIDCLQDAASHGVDGIVLNAGGYTHTSVALADAVAAISIPVVEVHLSNIYAREPERRRSLLSPVCRGTITGLGHHVYFHGVYALLYMIER